VVFLSWWQGVGISVLSTFGLIQTTSTLGSPDYYTNDDVAKGLQVRVVAHFSSYFALERTAVTQDFVVVIEMFFAAIAHHLFYSVSDFWSPTANAVTPLVLMQVRACAMQLVVYSSWRCALQRSEAAFDAANEHHTAPHAKSTLAFISTAMAPHGNTGTDGVYLSNLL
jgi:hypothetical protein